MPGHPVGHIACAAPKVGLPPSLSTVLIRCGVWGVKTWILTGQVSKLETPYQPGYYRLEVALNGMQYSTTPVMGTAAADFFFYNPPHVAQVMPDSGTYTGGTKVALTALPGALFVSPSAKSEITCMFKKGKTKLEVPGVFDGLTGEIACISAATTTAMTVRVEVAINGQQYTQDLVRFAYTPLIESLDIVLGPTSGLTRIHVIGSGFLDPAEMSADSIIMCRFSDVSGAVEDQFMVMDVRSHARRALHMCAIYGI